MLSLLHNHFGRMFVLEPFQTQFRNNYLIFKLNYFINPCAPTPPSSSHHPTPNYLCIPWHIGLAPKLLKPWKLGSPNKSRFVNTRLGFSLKCGLPKVQGLDTHGPIVACASIAKSHFSNNSKSSQGVPQNNTKLSLGQPWGQPKVVPKVMGYTTSHLMTTSSCPKGFCEVTPNVASRQVPLVPSFDPKTS
jgi:hypothetical protein